MEVDQASNVRGVKRNTELLASSGTSGSVSVSLHPLVIMNVSEHWTRVKAQEGRSLQVLGALIGKQKGRFLEIFNSFELKFNIIDNDIIIDKEYYTTKEEQFKQVFSDLDFLGWYTTGGPPDESDIKIHKQVLADMNESPVFLKLNTVARHTDHLPVKMYESVIDVVDGEATMLFVEIPFTLATEEAERIGVDHVARMSSDIGENSAVADHLTAQHNAIKMLHHRVKLILEYVKAINSGELPRNHEVLRDIYSLCNRLPVVNNIKFKEDFYNQCSDVLLITYLGAVTKGCNTTNQFVNKFSVLYDRHGMGRRPRGLLF